jgi:hypothetical protein
MRITLKKITILALTFTLFTVIITASNTPPNLAACWYNNTTKSYAIAIDLSLGYYPPEGQVSCKTIEEIRDAFCGIENPGPLFILSTYPHGKNNICRPLFSKEIDKLLKGKKLWKTYEFR